MQRFHGYEPEQERDVRHNMLLKVLAVVALAVFLAILAGTVYGLATGSRGKKLARADAEAKAPSGSLVFSGIGTVRVRTAGKAPALVVATVSFPYPAGDRAFAEELDAKKAALRAAAIAFLSGKAADELAPAYEGTVKAGLRDAFNELLSLGKVEEIWLADFSVLQ